MSKKGFTLTELLLVIVIVVALFLSVLRGALVSENTAVRALEKQGYSNVKIIDHDWVLIGLRGCDGHDAAKFTAEVTNPAGKNTEVFVCTGWLFKGATIRTD